MFAFYDRLTRGALNLANPYVHGTGETPAGRVWPYLRSHLHPLRWVLGLSVIVTVVTAAIEVWLISYAGQLIDMLAETAPSEIWDRHSASLIFAAVMIIALRPLSQFARFAVNDIGFSCNVANLFRWRAYDHLTKQSVGWFQEDLAGRTASRFVLMGNYASDAIYQSINAVAFGFVDVVGVVVLMAGTDIRLAIPLFVWLALYITLMALIVPRMVRAMEAFSAAKSGLLGKVVDTFSNFDTVSLFARRKDMEADRLSSLENTANPCSLPARSGLPCGPSRSGWKASSWSASWDMASGSGARGRHNRVGQRRGCLVFAYHHDGGMDPRSGLADFRTGGFHSRGAAHHRPAADHSL